MASTFTNNLLIENPTPQDPAQKNVWGTTENTGRTLLDSAVAGIQPLNLPAQAGYPTVILTSSQGQPDQARNAHFVFSGTLTANTLVLFPQSRNRMFTVNNTATGAFTVTVGVNNGSGAAAGTTVVVPQGQSINLFSDGTNVTTRVNGVVGGLTVSGGQTVDNLTVNGSTTYPNPTVGGTANAITLAYSVTPAGNVQGAKYAFKATAANTGAATVNINGLGVKNIFQRSPTGPAALLGGEIQIGDIVELAYDGTEFVMIGLASNAVATATPSGAMLPYAGINAPTGWLLCYGQPVGRTAYAALFAAITVSFTGTTTNGSATITNTPDLRYLSSGMPISGPGIPIGATLVSGTANSITISANCTASASGVALVVAPHGVGDGSTTFNIPDMRGRVPAGADAMGGTAASRLTTGGSGVSGGRLGAAGGDEHMQSHAHGVTDNGHAHNDNNALSSVAGPGNYAGGPTALSTGTTTASATTGIQIQTAGSGGSQNVQPTLVASYIIKT